MPGDGIGSGLDGSMASGDAGSVFSLAGSILRIRSGDLERCSDLGYANTGSGGVSVDCTSGRGDFARMIEASPSAVPSLDGP